MLDGDHGDGRKAQHAARLAADLKVEEYGNHFPDNTFVLIQQ
jgi:hypothetical protein